MKLIGSILVNTLAVLIAAYLIPNVQVDGVITAIFVALVLGFLNVFLKPILKIVSFPINLFTLGIFGWVINMFLIWLTDLLITGFTITGIITYLLFALVLSIVSTLLSWVFN